MVAREKQLDRLLIVIAGLLTGTLGGSYFNIWPQLVKVLEAFAFLHSILTHPLQYF